jgi:hypothetical protein
MNWIIKESNKLRWKTDLKVLFAPLIDDIDNYNWLVADLEYQLLSTPDKSVDLHVDLEQDYFILSSAQLKKIIYSDIQIIWGVFLAIPISINLNVDKNNLPFADGNSKIWLDGSLQHPDAVIEIICFDSSYTIIKFMDKVLSDKFKAYFDEAVELGKA